MLRLAVRSARSFGLDTRAALHAVLARSLTGALREQGLEPLARQLREVVPDIRDQYSRDFDADEFDRYWAVKIRALHAFQTQLALDAIAGNSRPSFIVDVGDSSGTHLAYLRALSPAGAIARALSINLDAAAVEKIRSRGGDAILGRAETVDLAGKRADLMLCFETLEHLLDPIGFLRRVAVRGLAERLLITVPFVRRSRVGLGYLRNGPPYPSRITAEALHVFELAPEDWRLLCRFAGWQIESEQLFLQYPRRSPWRTAAPLWRRLDYEGFFGVTLCRQFDASERYSDWPPDMAAVTTDTADRIA